MKVSTIKNLACVTLNVKAKDMEKVMKHSPDSLVLYKGEGEDRYPLYAIGLASCNDVCCIERFNDVGATFLDVDGEPTMWICLPEEAFGKKAEFIVDEYGIILSNITAIEKQIKAAVDGVNAKVAALKGAIKDVFASEEE